MGESFDSTWIMPSFRGVLPVRLVIVGTTIIIVPLIALFLFHVLSLSTPIFDPITCISVATDVTQVTIVPTTPSVTLLRWSDAASWVPREASTGGQARDPGLCLHGRGPGQPRLLCLASLGGA
jgi:hypothetical protein